MIPYLLANNAVIRPNFYLPLSDAGSGIVSTAEMTGTVATFTRATNAWTNLSDGTIGLVASGSPRSYYTPAGVYQGFLSEGARTNLCQRGEDFSAVWAAVGTPTLSAGTTTIGALSLSTVGDDSAAALEGYTQTITFTGDAVKAISIYVKQGTSTSSVVRLRDTTGSADRLLAAITWTGTTPVVTMTTGTDLTGTPAQQGSSGVYRLRFATSAVTAANTNSLQLYPATDAALSTANVGTIEWGGVQAEDAIFSSSLIRTPGSATVTRNADVLTYPYTTNSGTLFVSGVFNSGTVPLSQALASINNNATTDYIAVEKFNTNAGCNIVTGGVTQAAMASTATTDGAIVHGAMAYNTNSGAACLNAGAVSTDASITLPSVQLLGVGNTAGANIAFGTVKVVSIYTAIFPSTTLQSLAG